MGGHGPCSPGLDPPNLARLYGQARPHDCLLKRKKQRKKSPKVQSRYNDNIDDSSFTSGRYIYVRCCYHDFFRKLNFHGMSLSMLLLFRLRASFFFIFLSFERLKLASTCCKRLYSKHAGKKSRSCVARLAAQRSSGKSFLPKRLWIGTIEKNRSYSSRHARNKIKKNGRQDEERCIQWYATRHGEGVPPIRMRLATPHPQEPFNYFLTCGRH